MVFSDLVFLMFTIICKSVHDIVKEPSHRLVHEVSSNNHEPEAQAASGANILLLSLQYLQPLIR